MAEVRLKKHEGRLLKSGGAWIFDNEIAEVTGAHSNGDLVEVRDFDGYQLGTGFINHNSKIRVRMLTRNPEEQINAAFFRRKLQAAWDYRKAVVDTSSCRLVFGEADFIPGITIDKYEDVLVVQSLALGIDRWKEVIVDLLKEIFLEDGIRIRGVYERSDAKEREKEGLERKKGFIGEPFDTEVEIVENGVHYHVDVKDGQKTGFFLDQKYNRLAIQQLVRGHNSRGLDTGIHEVLDCFTHTGSFALNAALGGADHVTGVDASETASAMARRNAELNGLSNVEFLTADVLDLLPALREEGKQYDLVILDPPAFAKARSNVKNAMRGYTAINRDGMKLVKPGGYLATCSCSHFMTPDLFEKMLHDAARAAHVRVRQIEARAQAPDHPILWTAAESYYLKFYIFQICEER
ncbi:MAG: class I SAM-dependent rRNA methyltransferase [Lachnospiraceae bacterium]|nr:class I SAM-dependent rRNA methyltransferase [Lachnospiraceae bacterium]